ncbi:MAG: GrpB family protein [Chloroflexi bacterium]|nr:GrpB family protein [Chloroflexota bacterium]OJV99234.1 MAG: hypothetical protein BGO39_17395 [Chloroflexi bacterium 54-19]
MREIVVVSYDEGWPLEFEKIRAELLRVLGDNVVAIEHVGSTSVPGLWAKPVIDLDIVIEDTLFETVKARLASLGYKHEGDLGIAGREAFNYEAKPHLMAHHLYVCGKNSPELKRHLAFRNHLRLSKEDRDKYGKIKQEMAQEFPHDIEGYIAGKHPVIQEIYRKCGI